MSFRSSSSRGELIDVNGLLNLDDLDYEPDDKDIVADDQAPDQSNQEVHIPFSGGPRQELPTSIPLPDIGLSNYRNELSFLRVKSEEQDSFRSQYSNYGGKISTNMSLLDSSSDDEESNLNFEEGSYNGDLDRSYDPEMPSNLSPICDNNQNISQKPKRKGFNFTIQVSGNDRFCITPATHPPPQIRKKQKPWLMTTKRLNLNAIKVIKCPDQLTYVPVEDVCLLSDAEDTKSTSTRISTTSSSAFKMPLTRPPTKTKTKNLSVSLDTTLGTKMVQNSPVSAEPEDDIISLIASTNIEDDENAKVAEVNSESSSLNEVAKLDRVAQWVETEVQNQRPQVPLILKGLCFKYFFYNTCRHSLCTRGHLLPSSKINRFFSLSQEELDETFEFSINYPILFNRIYPIFAEVFASKGNKEGLLKMLNVMFNGDSNMMRNRVQGLKTIIENLQNMDNSLSTFKDAFDLLEGDIKANRLLGETFLELTIETNTTIKHWPLIRRLIVGGVTIPNRLADRFLISLMREPIDYQKCREIYQDILKYMCLDLPAVSAEVRDRFLTVSSQQDVNQRLHRDSPRKNAEQDLAANIEEKISLERNNFENSQLRVQTFFNARETQPNFRGPVVIQNPISSQVPETLNLKPPSFITETENRPDFASLNKPTPQNKYMNQLDVYISNNAALFQEPRKIINPQNNNRGKNVNSSDDEPDEYQSNEGTVSTENSSSRPSALVYNNRGDLYDPLNDYGPAKKRQKRAEPEPSADSEFDRLRRRNNGNKAPIKPTWGKNVKPVRESKRTNGRVQAAQNGLDVVTSSGDFVVPTGQVAPDQPSFGHFNFHPNYGINVSLHNYYTEKIDNVNIDEEDVYVLNDCVKYGDGKVFLDLVAKYNNPVTVQNFISMVLANLKGLNQLVGRTYAKLLDNIEKYQSLFSNLKLRVILEVITMNLLFEFDKRSMFDYARDVLMKFSDWDSLITSRLFITDISTGVSLIGRYLFIARLLVYTKPEMTFEILVCPAFHLLEDYSKWYYYPKSPDPNIFYGDLDSRNLVLNKFFQIGYLPNVVVVIQLYKIAFKSKEGIWRYDVREFVDPMVTNLINVQKIVFLKQILLELPLFVDYLEKNTLRAFVCLMAKHLSQLDRFRLYEKCVRRCIYNNIFQGQYLVNTLEIRTDMLQVEIELIILYYFHKLWEEEICMYGSDSLHIEIKLPGTSGPNKKFPLLNCNRSIFETKQYIELILKTKCRVDCKTLSSDMLMVERESLVHYCAANATNIKC